ncbi:MAG: ferritin-like domain-containing protein [Acidimicrobiales bacterium]
MSIDDKALHRHIEESQDLQSDAMRRTASTGVELQDYAHDLANRDKGRAANDLRALLTGRRRLVRKLGLTAGGIGLGGTLFQMLTSPASAAEPVEVQMLQTASSLEILAVATYGAALTLPFIKDGNAVVVKFAQTTMMQHDEHRKAFQAQTKALGGKEQTNANPKYAPVVEQAKPMLKTALDVVKLAATLEQVATETYLVDLKMFTDLPSRSLMASVMGVESQHLATLRAVRALLEGNVPDLIKIPLGADVAKLPAAAGSVAFPDAFSSSTMASPPAEGAL